MGRRVTFATRINRIQVLPLCSFQITYISKPQTEQYQSNGDENHPEHNCCNPRHRVGATSILAVVAGSERVSIHAPRAGGDAAWGNSLHALEIACHNCGLVAPGDLRKKIVTQYLHIALKAWRLANSRMSRRMCARLGFARARRLPSMQRGQRMSGASGS